MDKKRQGSRKDVRITPFKGGRTVMINGQRCTPEVARKFEEVTETLGVSKADVLERLILAEWERLFRGAKVDQ